MIGSGGWLPSIHFWLLKKSTIASDFQSNALHPIQSLYDHPSPEPYVSQGITYNPCRWTRGDCVPPWKHCNMNYGAFVTKWLSHNFNSICFEKRGCQVPFLYPIKKRSFQFSYRMSICWSVCDKNGHPPSDAFRENMRCVCVGWGAPSDYFES